MYIPFKQLPDTARVWIYQSDKTFTDTQIEQISELLTSFCDSWNNHGEGLKSSFLLKYHQFIVLGIDESHHEASGCSIDSSVQIIKKIENQFDVNLFDRMKTSFKIENHINLVSLSDFQKYVNEGKINSNTIVFNNMVKTVGEFNLNWEVKAKDSWHKRYF